MSENRIHAVVRVRALGPSGLNPPQIEVIDRLETLAKDGVIAEPDVDVWGMSMGTTQDDQDPAETRERVAEFEQWATEQGYSLQPAFSWRTADSEGDGVSQRREIVTPLITLAIYTDTEETLQGVYPHLDGETVCTIHEGVEALESLTGDIEQSTDEQREQEAVPSEDFNKIKRENRRLRDQLAATNQRIDDTRELVEYVEEERELQRQQQQKENATVWQRAKYWVFGFPESSK